MAGMINKAKVKVEEMLHKDTTTTGTHNTTATGAPHSSHAANTVDPTTHSGNTTGGLTGHSNTATGVNDGHSTGGLTGGNHSQGLGNTNHGTHGHNTANNGPHDTAMANKLDPRVDATTGAYGNTGHSTTGHSTTGQSTTGGYGNTANNGPHDSGLMNKADPRVDSTTGTYGSTGHSNAGYGNTAGHSTGNPLSSNTHHTHSANNGPHDSSMANQADPRVDSDNSRLGQQGYGNTTGHSTGNPLSSNTHNTHSANNGPHDSSMANKADPRVDSDNSRLGQQGYGNTTGHSTGNPLSSNTHHTHSANNGPHDSNMANKADPRVDSDNSRLGQQGYGNTAGQSTGNPLTGSHQQHGHHTGSHGHDQSVAGESTGIPFGDNKHTGQHGAGAHDSTLPGPAPSTAGPHKSNLLNKMDPRVDADMDGSKTVGGNKTYQQDDRVKPKPESSPDPIPYPLPEELVPDAATHSPTQMRHALNRIGSLEDFDDDHSKRHRYADEKADKMLPKYGSGIH